MGDPHLRSVIQSRLSAKILTFDLVFRKVVLNFPRKQNTLVVSPKKSSPRTLDSLTPCEPLGLGTCLPQHSEHLADWTLLQKGQRRFQIVTHHK